MFYKSNRVALQNKRNQSGLTLISLMVSIVITLFAVLSGLRLHNSHEESIEFVRNAATHNRLLMTALVVAQKEVQAAGFGIAGADQADVITQFSASSALSPASRSILWRYIDNGVVECRGLREEGVVIDGVNFRRLNLISSPTSCDANSALNSFLWDGVSGTLGLWEVEGELVTHLNANDTLFSFQLVPNNCTTSRLTDPRQHMIARIWVPNTAELNGHVLNSNTTDLCLVNINPV